NSVPGTGILNEGIGDSRTSGWTPAYMDKLIAINLTEVFGAGNEPTLEEMDLLISKIPSNWFEGVLRNNELSIATLDMIRGKASNQYVDNLVESQSILDKSIYVENALNDAQI